MSRAVGPAKEPNGERERDGYAMKRITTVIAGLRPRPDIYGNYAMEHPDEVGSLQWRTRVPERLELAKGSGTSRRRRCFATAENHSRSRSWRTRRSRHGDRQQAVRSPAEAALKGVPFAAEKPVAVDIEGCLEYSAFGAR